MIEDKYGFTISDKPIKVFEVDNIISYTFLIERDTIFEKSFENLIIQTDSLGKTEALIIKYNIISEVTMTEHGSSFDYSSEITGILADSSLINSKELYINCRDIYGALCTGDRNGCSAPSHTVEPICHQETPSCIKTFVAGEMCDVIDIPDSGGTPTPTGTYGTGGNTSSWQGGSGSGGPRPRIYTSENVPRSMENTDTPKTPCENLNAGTGSLKYRQNLKNLMRPENYTSNYEHGFFEKVQNGVTGYTWGTSNGSEALNIPRGSKNFTHIHPNEPKTNEDGVNYDGSIKMFSPNDVIGLLGTCQAANYGQEQGAFGVVVTNEGIFALTLLESVQTTPAIKAALKKFEENYESDALKIIGNFTLTPPQRKKAMQELMLTHLKKMNLENKVGLFEGETTPGVLNSVNIKWTRKTLDSNGELEGKSC